MQDFLFRSLLIECRDEQSGQFLMNLLLAACELGFIVAFCLSLIHILTSGNGDNGEEEDVPPPSVSDMELEAEARRQFFKEQMEAEDAPQLLLLG